MLTPVRFRTRNPESTASLDVEAVQVTADNVRDVVAWAGDRAGYWDGPDSTGGPMVYLEREGATLRAIALPGGWVCRTADGRLFVRPDEDLQAFYRAVD